MPNAAPAVRKAVRISQNGLAIVKAFEGCLSPVAGRPGYFKPYVDPVGVLTIGYGHTGPDVKRGMTMTAGTPIRCA